LCALCELEGLPFMSQYPDYPQWQALLLEQYSGELAWCGFITGLVLLWLLWRGLFKRWQVWVTFAAVAAFYVSIAIPIAHETLRVSALIFVIPTAGAVWFSSDRYLSEIDPKSQHFLIIALALVCRLPNIFWERLWYDEATTAAFAQVPIQNIWALGGDTHPPLFYLPFWVSSQLLGSSEFALRLPSLLFGVLTVYLIYRLTLSLGLKRETALVAALIVAVLPAALRYSNEARGYSQLAVCVLGMAIAVLEDRPRWFAGLAAATVLTQNMGYVYVATIGGVAFLWYVHQTKIWSVIPIEGAVHYKSFGPFQFYLQHKDKCWWWALLIPAAVGLAWLPFMIRQLQSISAGWWNVVSPGALVRPLFELTIGVRVDEGALLQVLAAVLVLTLLGLIAVRYWLFTTKGNLWFALCFGTPAIAAVVSLWTPVYIPRAFLPSFLAIVVVWAYLITERKGYERLAAAAVLVPLLAIAAASYIAPTRDSRDDWSVLLPQACEGAQIVYNTNISTYMIARYYLPDRRILLWSNANDISLFLPESVKDALSIEQVDNPPSGHVCLFNNDSFLTRQVETEYILSILHAYPHSQPYPVISEIYNRVQAFVVSVP
jgi:uncharacterized membrane protein